MTSCENTQKNVSATILSKCYHSRPNDRYKIVYSYPASDKANMYSAVLGDTLFFYTGDYGIINRPVEARTYEVTILMDNGDSLFGSINIATNELIVKYIPSSGPEVNITMSPSPEPRTGTHDLGTKNFYMSFENNILTTTITDISPLPMVTIVANLITGVITVT